MYALEICKHLKKDLNDKIKAGEIHSVFDTSFNIILENGRLITVAHASRPINHYSIIVPSSQSFKRIGLMQGQKVNFSPAYFEVQEAGLSIYLQSAADWDSSPVFSFIPASSENLQKKSDALAFFLVREGHREGIYPLLQYLIQEWSPISSLFSDPLPFTQKETVIKDRFLQFMKLHSKYYSSLISLNGLKRTVLSPGDDILQEIRQAASLIIGFGFGLTPHMDDFLAGLMSVSIYGSVYAKQSLDKILSLNQEIIRDSERLTTKVSHEMLLYNAEGKSNKALRDVLENLFNDENSPSLRYYFRKVNELGASSGTDTLLGVFTGLSIVIRTLNY